MDLVVAVYELTDKFPKAELYGLTAQLRRSAVSIPSNIAEGKYRGSKRDYTQFLRIAFASGAELETQVEISKRLASTQRLDFARVDRTLVEVMKMLNTLIRNLSAS